MYEIRLAGRVLVAKKGVTKDLQADWNWIRYQIGGKMFAALCLEIQVTNHIISRSNWNLRRGRRCGHSTRTLFRAIT